MSAQWVQHEPFMPSSAPYVGRSSSMAAACRGMSRNAMCSEWSDHRELRERMGRAARERALELYPLEKAGARLADLLSSLARGAVQG